MDIHNFAQAGALFIKPQEVKDNPQAVFVILTEGEIKENKFKNEVLHLEGEFNKEKRSFDLSKTNTRIIEKSLGSDTKNWIGHYLILEVYKMKNNEQKLVDAINIKEVK